MRSSVANNLRKAFEPGRVYRTRELRSLSKNLSRDLKKLVEEKQLVQAGPGLYYKPKMSRFGPLPAEPLELVRAFLGDDNFLALTLSDYNPLGVGLTQLYNELVVYNRKRHGQFVFDGKKFFFKVRPDFPNKLSKEFLLVDVLNNRGELAEDTEKLEKLVAERASGVDQKALSKAAQSYGKVATKNFFENLRTQ